MSAPRFYDEMHGPQGEVLPHYRHYSQWLGNMAAERIVQKRHEAEVTFHRVGITFAVFGEEAGSERLIPLDIIPRIIPAGEWALLEAGIKQIQNRGRGSPKDKP